jgi:hypothetical protein
MREKNNVFWLLAFQGLPKKFNGCNREPAASQQINEAAMGAMITVAVRCEKRRVAAGAFVSGAGSWVINGTTSRVGAIQGFTPGRGVCGVPRRRWRAPCLAKHPGRGAGRCARIRPIFRMRFSR